MTSLAFAWRCLVRQPARAVLAILGVAAVGALLFDMLLLSRGLVVSMENLLDDVGFDVRVTAMDGIPFAGPRIPDVSHAVAAIAGLSEVDRVVPMRLGNTWILHDERRSRLATVIAAPAAANAGWTLVAGSHLDQVQVERGTPRPLLVSPGLADTYAVGPGAGVTLRGACDDYRSVLPTVEFRVVGIAEFSFDGESELTVAMSLDDLLKTCAEEPHDEADVVLVASRGAGGADAAASAIRRRVPELYASTNAELIDRFGQDGLSYFRQISTVLSSVTLFFGFLLVTTLLTVSVNQRMAEIAALRALGFPRRRIAADLLWESVAIVGAGGVLALPLGAALAVWLDAILRSMPGLPAGLHFFVFQPYALVLHVGLMTATSVLAAVYPVQLATRLPIAATLRDEVVS